MVTNYDRRTRRSENFTEALTYQLQHVKQQYGLRQIALVDESGVLASAGEEPFVDDLLIAFSFAVATGGGEQVDRLNDDLRELLPTMSRAKVGLREFDLDGRSACTYVVAEEGVDVHMAVEHCLRGARRIATTTVRR